MSRRNLMNEKKFEEYVKNVNCYKLASIPEKFLIKFNKRGNKRRHRVCMRESNDNTALRKRQIRDKILPRDDVRLELDDDYGFDVIRHRRERQLLGSDYIYEVHEHRNDLFEKYERGAEGLYKETLLRVKRSNSAEDLIHKLTNLPPLRPLSDEVFAMIGDSLSMGCYPSGYNYSDVEQENLNWMTDRDNVENKNVFTNGSVLHLRNLLKRDSGIYSCYDDLRAIQKVGVLMRQLTCGNYCSVRIDEPVCLRNKEDDTYLLRTITVLIPQYKRIVNCTAECQRNLRSSLAVLFARNAPVLASIPVVMAYYDGSILEEIKTWTPSSRVHKSFVSHTLRTRDTNGHQEYNSLAANSEPNSIHVVVACPAGFFLVSTQKICGICPPNTYSAEADNACTSCPEGTVSDAGSGGCHLTLSRLRRSFCYEPCILVKTIGFITLVTIIYYTASRLRRYLAVCCKTEDLTENFSPKQKGKPRSFQGGPAHHVTHHSERKKYPPLPPIDF
ncbi:unnamed protein product [Leptosia nina]|uniref:Ig-like domain-containing protein n=1 Tax=Leptosia nina TaxID=320188 RepID=A0AAV1JYN5_9NEOP